MTIVVVGMDHLQYRPTGVGEYHDAPVWLDVMCVITGSEFTYQAISDPEDVENWPSTKPAWGGEASGTGTFKNVTFNTASTGPTDYRTVSAECGNTVSVYVQVIDDLSAFPVESKRNVTGDLQESYYAVKEDEHYESEGSFRFCLNLGGWTAPVDLGWELWDADGDDDLITRGYGDNFGYIFDSEGVETGDTFVRFYVDTNGDTTYDSGEPMRESPEFWVQPCEEYSFDVDYSSELGTVTLTEVQNAFDAAAAVLLKKNTADDYRACVKFTVTSLTSFTADEDRPDPADNAAKRELHYDADSDVALVQEIDDVAVGYSNRTLEEIIIDWDDAKPRDIAHEIGHGVGLDDDDQVMEHVMYYSIIYIPGDQYGTQLTQSHANDYD